MNEFISSEDIDKQNFYNECNLKMDSYITKEELIEIISKINFIKVKSADLELITGCICDGEKENFQLLYKNIRID